MTPTYVTFKQAVALKDKGFDEELNTVYNLKSEPTKSYYNTMKNSDIEHGTICTRPEQWMVVEWLRVNHGIWISVNPDIIEYNNSKDTIEWMFKVYRLPVYLKNGKIWGTIDNGRYDDIYYYSTPENACSAAWDDILTNLIWY